MLTLPRMIQIFSLKLESNLNVKIDMVDLFNSTYFSYFACKALFSTCICNIGVICLCKRN